MPWGWGAVNLLTQFKATRRLDPSFQGHVRYLSWSAIRAEANLVVLVCLLAPFFETAQHVLSRPSSWLVDSHDDKRGRTGSDHDNAMPASASGFLLTRDDEPCLILVRWMEA